MGIIKGKKIRKPIRKTFFVYSIIFMLVLSILVAIASYFVLSRNSYNNFQEKIGSAVTYIENNADADDLSECLKTKTTSEKYATLQQFLNGIIDDLRFDYIYLVIPDEELMYNVVSATSQEERDAGEEDMPFLETTDAYSAEELKRFKSYWDKDEISYFEESSDYGTFYTGIKPLKDSKGNTVCLICVDISSSDVHRALTRVGLLSAILSLLGIGIFTLVIFLFLSKNVTKPLVAIENSARDFAEQSHEINDISEMKYKDPNITTSNELESLSNTINLMVSDTQKRIIEVEEAEKRASYAEEENIRLQKINELSESVSSLLANMPVMTFSKDVNNGKYLACNKLFCEYANKKEPSEIAGLTDYDIFPRSTAEHFVEDDKKAIEMKEPYVFNEDVLDAKGNPRQFQTTKLKFIDTTGRECLLGMSIDITELQANIEERATYSNISRALSKDYSYMYYVDLETEEFIEYHSDINETNLVVERRGPHFFDQSREDAVKVIYEEDQQAFLDEFYKDKILDYIDRNGVFTITYRMIENGKLMHFSMKISKLEDDDKHLIIGVNNIENQMKIQEAAERLREENITFARITALAGNYMCIYTVDPETNSYVEYSATKDYEVLGLTKKGEDFFEVTKKESKKNIYSEDYERFSNLFTKENVLKEIEKNGIFVLDYRLLIQTVPVYVSLKAAIVNEKDGPQLIVGISNIDVQIKREQEYAYNLAIERNKANVDALTGVKNKHAYVDLESQINTQINDKEDLEFAIAIFDVNDLKKTNDVYGHQMGDKLIREASKVISDLFKHSPVFRVGGDEFCVVIKGEDYNNMDELVRELEKKNEHNVKHGGVVVACGVDKYNKDRNVSMVFERADTKMYENKRFLKNMK